MTSQCGPRRPNLNETKMRRRYDVACRVGIFLNLQTRNFQSISDLLQCLLVKYLNVSIIDIAILFRSSITLQIWCLYQEIAEILSWSLINKLLIIQQFAVAGYQLLPLFY